MKRLFFSMNMLLSLFFSSALLAERWCFSQSPYELFPEATAETFKFKNLPHLGKTSKEPWFTKSWPYSKGRLAKRRDGTLAPTPYGEEYFGRISLTEADIENLSPVEKLDLVLYRRGKRGSYTEAELENCKPYENQGFWCGLCDKVRRIQYLCDKPKAMKIEGVHFNENEVVALKCLYQDHVELTKELNVKPFPEKLIEATNFRHSSREGSAINAGVFHITLANQLGNNAKPFILIPHHFYGPQENREFAVYNELVYKFETEILCSDKDTVILETKIESISENGNQDVIIYRTFVYELELEDGNIIGGNWKKGKESAPVMIWIPDEKKAGKYTKALRTDGYLDYLLK